MSSIIFVPRAGPDPDRSAAGAVHARRPGAGGRNATQARVLATLDALSLRGRARDAGAAPRLGPGDRGHFEPLTATGLTLARFARGDDAARAAERLSADCIAVPDFAVAMPRAVAATDDQPAALAGPGEEDGWPEASGIARAHRAGNHGRGVLIGALDTGVDIDHEQFRKSNRPNKAASFVHVPLDDTAALRRVRGFDTEGHGTHVSGIMVGNTVGIARQAAFRMAAVIESETMESSMVRCARGLDWILRSFMGPDCCESPAILNLSIGFPADAAAEADLAAREAVLRYLVETAVAANVLVVAAVGNDGAGRHCLPAGYADVLAAGAVTDELSVAAFSGSGAMPARKPDLCGYGVSVKSAEPRSVRNDSLYAYRSGTSMAAPYVAGIAALTWARNPSLTAGQVREQVFATALRLDGEDPARVGRGLAVYTEETA